MSCLRGADDRFVSSAFPICAVPKNKRPCACLVAFIVKPTAFLLAAFSLTAACSAALAFSGPAPVIADPVPQAAVPVPVDVVTEVAPYASVTPLQRLGWFDRKTFGVQNLGGSLPYAAWQTLVDHPHEAGPHWEGFGERYGVALSTNAVSNAMEAGLGAIWGEDPRYRRDGVGVPLKSRLGHVVKWTVVAPNRNGELRPAYARFIAFTGSSFISNEWREPSDTDAAHAFGRVGLGLLGRMGSNAFEEFWPDAKRKLLHWGARN
jgi:hypothetical protein